MPSTVGIIIIHYGNFDLTLQSLRSIPSQRGVEIFLVLNSPVEFSRLTGITNFPLHIIDRSKNLGFAKAVNLAIHQVRKRRLTYTCLLNNDACLAKPTLVELQRVESELGVSIVGSTVYDMERKTPLLVTARLNKPFFIVRHLKPQYSPESLCIPTDFVNGCCMLIKTEVFDTIGTFDERFFVYCEDVDFSIRAKAAEIPIGIATRARVYHRSSSSTENNRHLKNYYIAVSSYKLIQKYVPFKFKRGLVLIGRFLWDLLYSIHSALIDKRSALQSSFVIMKAFRGYLFPNTNSSRIPDNNVIIEVTE